MSRNTHRVRHPIPKATLFLIYRALILPHFNYCNTVWGNCGITLRNKLQNLQHLVARVLTYPDVGDLLELLKQKKKLTGLHEIDKATMVYKSLQGFWLLISYSSFTTREMGNSLTDSENKLCIHYHEPIITTIVLVKVTLFFGMVSLDM